MSIILAIEPDRRRAAQLTGMARAHLRAELLVAPNASQAVDELAGRVPDVLLTAPLLPSQEEAAISDYLRQLGSAAAHVQTLTIPLLANGSGGHDRPVLSAFRRGRTQKSEAEGCDPSVFAEQITEYLREARERRTVPALVAVPPPPAVEISEPENLPVPATLTKRETISELLARLFPTAGQEDDAAAPEAVVPLAKQSDAALPVEPPHSFVHETEAESGTPYELRPITTFEPVISYSEESALPSASARKVVPMPISDHERSAVNVAVAVSMNVDANVVIASPSKRTRKAQPIDDVWGFFDPNQCGFPALVAKLDEISARDRDS